MAAKAQQLVDLRAASDARAAEATAAMFADKMQPPAEPAAAPPSEPAPRTTTFDTSVATGMANRSEQLRSNPEGI